MGRLLVLGLFFLYCFPVLLFAQYAGQEEEVQIFLDCKTDCDFNFIRTEISFVNYVTDRTVADVHVLITRERTGAGGNAYTLDFIGLKRFEGQVQKLQAITGRADTNDEQRHALTRILKAGLVPYTVGTVAFEDMDIAYNQRNHPVKTETTDKWNKWTFSISGSGNIQGEANYKRKTYQTNFSVARVTDVWKVSLNASTRSDETINIIEDKTYNNVVKNQNVWSSIVRGVDSHWSAKISPSVGSSSYDNIGVSYRMETGVEYSVFPYSESNRRAFKFQYEPNIQRVQYASTTIFNKDKETLVQEALTAYLGLQQPWGSASTNFRASHYFHDLSKFRLSLSGNMDWRITRGLSVGLNGAVSYIKDQLSLSKSEYSEDDIFLRARQLATTYSYRTEFRLTYRFGSFSNNTVNTRFDEGR